MPRRGLPNSHSDYAAIQPLVKALIQAGGGYILFSQKVPLLIRKAIDEVIDAPRTNRFTLSEIEKTEKTYLGTKVEIILRAELGLAAGRILDASLAGVETDIKHTMGSNWTIPMEAVGHPCILIRENEQTALCSVGLIIVREAYLNPGKNRDSKRTFSNSGLSNVWWILRDHPYPANIWEQMPPPLRKTIMKAGGGTQRVAALFRELQKRPISRLIVQAVAQQDDYMKRIRRNGGARDLLAREGTAILWGQKDRAVISKLRLGPVNADEFISYSPSDPAEIALLKKAGHVD